MKSTAIAFALAATAVTWSGAAQASTVIWEASGSAVGSKALSFDLPETGGAYRLEYKSSIDRYITPSYFYTYYYREYLVGDPWIELSGNETPIYDEDGVFGKSGTYLFGIQPYTVDINGDYAEVRYAVDPSVSILFALGPFSNDSQPFTYSVRLIDLAAVPEPATWALMIAGFGATGVALRRRARRQTAAALA